MAASLASKWSRVGRSLFGGLRNNLSGLLSTSHQMAVAHNSFLSQQRRNFIQMGTVLKVVDNSGAKTVSCIHPVKGKKVARLGDTIVASVKELQLKKGETVKANNAMKGFKVKKGEIVKAVIVRTAMQVSRCDGSILKFDENAVALLDKQSYRITKKRNIHRGRRAGKPIGKRVFGPVPYELRKKWMLAVLTLAEDTV